MENIKGLTNTYVEKLCKKIIKQHKFEGVFPCDIQPKCKLNTFSVIFNTGDSNSKGEHFIAIYANSKYLYYFDSFGEQPNDSNIIKFIKENIKNRKFITFNQKIQSDQSNFCGFYCIAFLLAKDRKIYYKFKQIFNTNNLKQNDVNIIYFIIKILSK